MAAIPGQVAQFDRESRPEPRKALANHAHLTDWVLENGGYLHPDVEIDYSPAAGYHAVVAMGKTVMPATRISSCPISCTLSVLNALNITPFSDRGTKFPKAFLQNNVENRELLQAFYLMEQSVLGEKSWWSPYLCSLPTVNDVNSLQFDTIEDKKWIKGTNLEAGYEQLMSKWKGYHQEGLKELRALGWPNSKCDAYTWELYRWAASIFGSRGFSSVVLADTAPAEQARIGAHHGTPVDPYIKEAFAERFAVLLPLLDILNHKPKAKVDWQPRTSFVGLQVRDSYSEGEQLFNNYGPKDNEGLLLSYGFVSEDRSFQHVALSLRVPPGTLLDVARRWSPDLRSNPEHKLYILSTDHFKTTTATCLEAALFDYDLLDTLSVLMANERESQAMINSRKTLMSMGLSKPHAFDDFRNLLAVLAQILVHCEKGRERLMSTRPEGKPYGAKQKNANILRDQQISHYSDAVCLCKVILAQACGIDVDASDITEASGTLQSQIDKQSFNNITALRERHERITRSGETFSTTNLLDMLPGSTKHEVTELMIEIGQRICPVAQSRNQSQTWAQCRLSLCLSAAHHAHTRGGKIAQPLANWLEQALSWYPPDDDTWAYVPTEGPWPPGEEPPTALQHLLRAAAEYLRERDRDPVDNDDDNSLSAAAQANNDTVGQWLNPKALCWAYNVVNEETLQVPIEIARLSHKLYEQPHPPKIDPMDVVLYINSQ